MLRMTVYVALDLGIYYPSRMENVRLNRDPHLGK